MTNIQKRVENTEVALVALWSLIEDTLPQEHREATTQMMNDFFDANVELGAEFDLRNGFKR